MNQKHRKTTQDNGPSGRFLSVNRCRYIRGEVCGRGMRKMAKWWHSRALNSTAMPTSCLPSRAHCSHRARVAQHGSAQVRPHPGRPGGPRWQVNRFFSADWSLTTSGICNTWRAAETTKPNRATLIQRVLAQLKRTPASDNPPPERYTAIFHHMMLGRHVIKIIQWRAEDPLLKKKQKTSIRLKITGRRFWPHKRGFPPYGTARRQKHAGK